MQNNTSTPIFRFNFSNNVINELKYFAKLHCHEDRTEFKENWNEWIDDNTELINFEKKRLENLGYDGDVEDKMYKSVRYYYRKKSNNQQSTERCLRVVVSSELLSEMDKHIISYNFNKGRTPQTAYEEFCEKHIETINNEFNILEHFEIDDFFNKIKKTYKNRFYLNIRKQIQTNE
jgi:hypothetical protein